MADPVFELKKSAMLEIIEKHDCGDADYINEHGIDYASMLTMLQVFGWVFDCDNDYLDEILSLWTDSDLVAQNVYYNKTLVNQNNIFYAANTVVSNNSQLFMGVGAFVSNLTLTKNSHIEHLTISGNNTLDFLIVAAGSSIADILIEPGSKINHILIKTCDPAFPSSIGEITGVYGDMAGDEGSTYGGDSCDNSLL